MASKGKKEKYTGDDKVDAWLLNQIVKHFNHDEIRSLARDLEVEESVYSSITKDKEKTFKVRDFGMEEGNHKAFKERDLDVEWV